MSSQLPSKKLRSKLRSVMSDRVMRITRQCSKQHQQQSSTSRSSDSEKRILTPPPQLSFVKVPNFSFSQLDTQSIPIINNVSNLSPPATTNLADITSLIEHCRAIYNETISKESTDSLVQPAKSIVEAILDYSKQNSLDIPETVDSILKENFLKTNAELKQIYKNDTSDKMKTEGQLQILLRIENYMGTCSNEKDLRIDDDFVWELANSIRWLSQTFKQRFKIEKFFFSVIYQAYHTDKTGKELIQALKEELGYDEESENQLIKPDDSVDSKTQQTVLQQAAVATNSLELAATSQDFEFKTPIKKQTNETQTQKENIVKASFRATFLFEELTTQSNEVDYSSQCDTVLLDDLSQASFAESQCDFLDEIRKKKLHMRSNSISMPINTVNRSIVVQRKRTKLKIRSPRKSPTKNLCFQDVQRKSPRVRNINRDRQMLLYDSCTKRPGACLVTDTPDDRQYSSAIAIRQEKRKKRFSVASNFSSPVVPETPVKNS